MKRTLTFACIRLVVPLAPVVFVLIGGCIGDKFTLAKQRLEIIVGESAGGGAPRAAVVTTKFPADNGITPYICDQLNYARKANLATALTDASGRVTVDILTTGPAHGTGPDQVTGGPIALRVEVGDYIEYLWDGEVRAGARIEGKRYVVRVVAVGRPITRNSKGS